MNTELSVRTAFCSEYKALLGECHTALEIWNERRDEIYQSRLRAKKFDDELRRLQAKYAIALHLLQKHAHDCPLCPLVSRIAEGDSENSSNIFSDKDVYIC
jgi:hypothetical protein